MTFIINQTFLVIQYIFNKNNKNHARLHNTPVPSLK